MTAVRIAFGGMAGTPKRARAVEAALIGKIWSEETVMAARPAFDEEDYQPLTDWRASAAYRALTAKNLLLRFFLETTGAASQLSSASRRRNDGPRRQGRLGARRKDDLTRWTPPPSRNGG